VLSHLLMLHAAGQPWAVAALLGPLLAVTGAVAWRSRQWALVAGVGAACAVLAGVVARGGVEQINRLYVLQHAGIHLALGLSFALSLRGELSLIGRIAQRVHALSPPMVAYTRGVTLAWVAYFFGMTVLSLWTYAAAAWETWSLLSNVGTPLAMAVLFVGEYLLRYRLHPEFERVTLMDAVRAYRQGPAAEVAGR
jgi:uncharacterized membrane protein